MATTGIECPFLFIKFFISLISDGFLTKLRAIQSTPAVNPNSRSSISLSVKALTDNCTSGKFTPLLLERTPPTVTLHSNKLFPMSTFSTIISIFPSSNNILFPEVTSWASLL